MKKVILISMILLGFKAVAQTYISDTLGFYVLNKDTDSYDEYLFADGKYSIDINKDSNKITISDAKFGAIVYPIVEVSIDFESGITIYYTDSEEVYFVEDEKFVGRSFQMEMDGEMYEVFEKIIKSN